MFMLPFIFMIHTGFSAYIGATISQCLRGNGGCCCCFNFGLGQKFQVDKVYLCIWFPV